MHKYEYRLDFGVKFQTLDVINHYNDIQDVHTLTLNYVIGRLNLQNNTNKKFARNIFDELAVKLNVE